MRLSAGRSSLLGALIWGWSAVTLLLAFSVPAQQAASTPASIGLIQGTVIDAEGHPASGAVVRLKSVPQKAVEPISFETTTDSAGSFSFSRLVQGEYEIAATSAASQSNPTQLFLDGSGKSSSTITLHLSKQASAPSDPSQAAQEMEFSDQPHFTVAGVTDYTAAGGHGSDVTLRASESLTHATTTLKPEPPQRLTETAETREIESTLKAAAQRSPRDFLANENLGEFYLRQARFSDALSPLESAAAIRPSNDANLYALASACEGVGDLDRARDIIGRGLSEHRNADAFRLAAILDEKRGDPLRAVQEFEQAATLDPSEENEFEWASELLQHRAIWQAEQVFRKAAVAYPKSFRIQAGLGAALFAGARYDDAALQLCKASDLDPADPDPYVFLGRVAVAAPKPLACVESKLARFVQLRPESSEANYLYAMVILKSHPGQPESQSLAKASLIKAVSLDAKCSDAYLELGILAATSHDNEGAIRSYTKAIEGNPESADAHYRLAVAYDRIGESTKAQQEFALHKQIEKQQGEATERQRKAVKQFLFADPNAPAATSIK